MTDLALFESLLSCKTVDELYVKTAAITNRLGFEHFFYGAELNIAHNPPYQFMLSGYPVDWGRHYLESGYQEIDPVIRHCKQSVVPLLWDDLTALQPAAKKVMNEAKDFGLASGVSLSSRGPDGGIGLLSVTVDKNNKQTQQDMLHALGGVQLLANYLHESVRMIVLSREVQVVDEIQQRKQIISRIPGR